MEGYESSAVMGERHAFLCNQCKTSSFSSCLLCMCVCNYDILSPCIFPRREMEYSKTIVNSVQECLQRLIDIYMKVNE